MPSNSAEYMREYRARKKAAVSEVYDILDMTSVEGRVDAAFLLVQAKTRIAELEAEVRHLKAELAKRPSPFNEAMARADAYDRGLSDRFNTRPFTPVPKVKPKRG